MNKINIWGVWGVCMLLLGCSPVKLPETNQYQLTSYSDKLYGKKNKTYAIQVTAPEAVSGIQTQEMVYIKKPFKLEYFAKNEWVSPPAEMLFPLLVKSLESTGLFYAVTSSTYSEKSEFRLDTQLLSLQQNFTKKPSVIQFSAKVVLSNSANNRILASKMVHVDVPCTQDSPYGGVQAANQAVNAFTEKVSDFVVQHIKQ